MQAYWHTQLEILVTLTFRVRFSRENIPVQPWLVQTVCGDFEKQPKLTTENVSAGLLTTENVSTVQETQCALAMAPGDAGSCDGGWRLATGDWRLETGG